VPIPQPLCADCFSLATVFCLGCRCDHCCAISSDLPGPQVFADPQDLPVLLNVAGLVQMSIWLESWRLCVKRACILSHTVGLVGRTSTWRRQPMDCKALHDRAGGFCSRSCGCGGHLEL
jgi:hypothetical protein